MKQEQEWRKWLDQQSDILGESIAWAAKIFNTTDVGIERSRHYGTALIVHSIECARAIRLCIRNGLPGPAFSLARAQYEGALRGHIVIHEIDLEQLNDFLGSIQRWKQTSQSNQPPPRIEIRKRKWYLVGVGTNDGGRPLQRDFANLFMASIENLGLVHDLTHSGMTHALQMLDEDGCIAPNYTYQNQTMLLFLANRAVMFATMTWPGAEQKYCREIEQRIERMSQLKSIWEPHI